MKYELIIRPEAEADMQGALGWYEERVLGLGREFLRCVDVSIAQISRSRESFPVIYQGIRRVLTRRFPFGVFYIVIGAKIIILAVLHARREPGKWQKRR